MDRLRYLNKGELREEIVYAVGGDPTRYGIDSQRKLNKADLQRICETLQPTDSDLTVHGMDLAALHHYACRWAGGEYVPNAGLQCGIRRNNLKKIHREVGSEPLREVVST